VSVALAIPLSVLFVVTVGKLTGRLLGIRLGHWRGALVGAVGWVGGLLAAAYTIGEKTADGGRTIQADSVTGCRRRRS
jgi:ABC-type cobalamin transport system permease subunit